MKSNAREIDDQATRWAVRLDGQGLSEVEQAALQAWLSGEPRRAGALLRAQGALSYLDRGRALNGVIPRDHTVPFWTRRKFLVSGVSVGALAAGLGAVAIGLWHSRRYTTEVGEVRRVPLLDGSVATINTHSVLDVSFEEYERKVNLTQGEVWFQVAKDAKRPFVVSAGRIRVRALGTAFSVRRREEGADVLVTEGVVDAWVHGAGGQKTRLVAGSRATVTQTGTKEVEAPPSVVARTLAWREGEIALEGETLSEAVAEFNRYNTRKLVINNPVLAEERLVGQFRTTEPEAFAHAVVSTLGASFSEDANTLILSRP